jgi:hypothetical protein
MTLGQYDKRKKWIEAVEIKLNFNSPIVFVQEDKFLHIRKHSMLTITYRMAIVGNHSLQKHKYQSFKIC